MQIVGRYLKLVKVRVLEERGSETLVIDKLCVIAYRIERGSKCRIDMCGYMHKWQSPKILA